MRRFFFLMMACLVISSSCSLQVSAWDDPNSLPIYLTEEEKLRLDEIGISHRSTRQPTGEVRNPGEWEPSEGVIIRWPLGIPVDIIAEMSEDIVVTTIVANTSAQQSAITTYTAGGVNMANTGWVFAATDSYWTRDYGPWFIFDDLDMAIVDHIYNRPRPNDDAVPQAIGTTWGMTVHGMDLIHTGGNHMSEGLGMSMSTELVYDENTTKTQTEVDNLMREYLGNDYTVLEYIEDSGIHHIDCWAKFLSPDTILVKNVDPGNDSYDRLNARAAYLSQQTSAWGVPYNVVRIYCPTGTAYTNSIILNDKVIVPIFGSEWDDDALQVYQNTMPGYEILGFDGSWLDDDAIHCRTMGVPDRGMLFIDHVPFRTEDITGGDYLIAAKIVPHSGDPLIPASLKIHYSVNGGSWQSAALVTTGEPDRYAGCIPVQAVSSVIRYYIEAADESGRVEKHPYIGATWAHEFTVLGPSLEYDSNSFTDECNGSGSGVGNTFIDPGEDVTLQLTLHNNGAGLVTGVTGTVSTTTPGVTVTDNTALFPDIGTDATGGSISNHFGFHVDSGVSCGAVIDFNIHMVSNEGNWDDSFALVVGNQVAGSDVALWSESYDGATFPPTGWGELDVSGNAGDWARSTATVHPSGGSTHTGAGLAYFNSYTSASGSTTRLYRSSPTAIPSGVPSASVILWMYHDTGYTTYLNEGVNIQVSTNGSTWTTVGSLIPRYDGSTGWKEHTVDVSSYIGQSVYIGILGVSQYGNDCHIDDVSLNYEQEASCTVSVCTGGCSNPTQPTIGSVTDDDACAQSGVTVTFAAGTPSTSNSLLVDSVEVAMDITSPYPYNPGNTSSHSYVVRSYNTPSCHTDSTPTAATDAVCSAPPEIGTGTAYPGDAVSWTGTSVVWPSTVTATGYRLYRGLQSNLANLASGNTDFCTKYDGGNLTLDCALDDASIVAGRCYYYLVTAYNGGGEGPAGNMTAGPRVVNTTGACP